MFWFSRRPTASYVRDRVRRGGDGVVEDGVYVFDEPLEVPTHTHIRGEGGVVFVAGDKHSPVILADSVSFFSLENVSVEVPFKDYRTHAVFVRGADNFSLRWIRIYGNDVEETAGICLLRCSGAAVESCHVRNFRYGMFLTTAVEFSDVRWCYVDNCKTGMYIYGAEEGCLGDRILYNRIEGPGGTTDISGLDGILVDNAAECFVVGNRCTRNMEHGVYISASERMFVHGNIAQRNGCNGIQMVLTSESIVTNNFCISNKQHGIYLDRCADNMVSGNICMDNLAWGILEVRMDHKGPSFIDDNYFKGNSVGNIHRS
ncbi:MAG: hypothetical protein DRP95_00125 [Candidatus Latescibacterota bacterium]|nr:MAG: hypothetical protein DRP95_00125 [Candidatus Latescibacterota bacterium]